MVPGSRIEGLARRLLVGQLIATIVLAATWGSFGEYSDALAVIFGGGISMLVAWLHKRGVRKAEERAIVNPKSSMLVLYVGAVLRFLLLMAVLAIGLGLLQLPALPLFTGFVLAQLGYLVVARR